jgi:hypothetical protein
MELAGKQVASHCCTIPTEGVIVWLTMIYRRYGFSYRGPIAAATGSEPYVTLPPDGI